MLFASNFYAFLNIFYAHIFTKEIQDFLVYILSRKRTSSKHVVVLTFGVDYLLLHVFGKVVNVISSIKIL